MIVRTGVLILPCWGCRPNGRPPFYVLLEGQECWGYVNLLFNGRIFQGVGGHSRKGFSPGPPQLKLFGRRDQKQAHWIFFFCLSYSRLFYSWNILKLNWKKKEMTMVVLAGELAPVERFWKAEGAEVLGQASKPTLCYSYLVRPKFWSPFPPLLLPCWCSPANWGMLALFCKSSWKEELLAQNQEDGVERNVWFFRIPSRCLPLTKASGKMAKSRA